MLKYVEHVQSIERKFYFILFQKIFKFWIDKGVAGFRLDAVKHFFEDAHFRDEPVISQSVFNRTKTPGYNDLKHIYTSNLKESYELIHELRLFCEKATKKFNDFER